MYFMLPTISGGRGECFPHLPRCRPWGSPYPPPPPPQVEDLTLSKAISTRPLRAKKSTNELSMLAEELFFTLSLEK